MSRPETPARGKSASSKPGWGGNRWRTKTNTWRSGLEESNALHLDAAGVKYTYESEKIAYTVPESGHKYTPDFIIDRSDGARIYIETKGMFDLKDRKKHLLIQAQHPNIDLRFVFSRSAQKIRKGSKTSYADWCQAHGFQYADKLVPLSWLTP